MIFFLVVVNLLVLITLRNAVEGAVTTEENIVYKIDFYLFDGIIFYSMGRLGSSSASKYFPLPPSKIWSNFQIAKAEPS
jgi:hypothetical protein